MAATRACFKGHGRSYYRIFLNTGLIQFAPLVVIVAGGVILATILHEGPVRLAELFGILGLGFALLYAVVPVAAGYTRARIARFTFMGTRFGGLRFAGRHTARGLIGLIGLYVSNLLLILLTLGLGEFVAAAGERVVTTDAAMAEGYGLDMSVA